MSANSRKLEPLFDVPKEIGCFSVNCDKGICMDLTGMKICIPLQCLNIPLDLSECYDDDDGVNSEFSSVDKMKHLLKWILFRGMPKECPIEFVTLQETIQKILRIPYCVNQNESWNIVATKFQDIIYLMEVDAEPKKLCEKTSMSRICKRFKQFMTADISGGVRNSAENAQGLEGFSRVLINKLGHHTLLYTAVVDAAKRDEMSEAGTRNAFTYVDMNIKASKPTPGYEYWFKTSKSLQWWTKSYVAGVKDIVCGFRDKNGTIASIETIKTSELPPETKEWTPDVCFDFLNGILATLKNTVIVDDHRTVYKFEFVGQKMIASEIINNVDDNGICIIPDSYAICKPICHSLLQSRLDCQHSYQRPELAGYPSYCDGQAQESYMNPVNQFTEPALFYSEQHVQSSNLQMHHDIPENRMCNVTTSNEINFPANQIGIRNRLTRRISQRQNRSFRNKGSCVPFQSEEKSNASFSVASGSKSRRSRRKRQTLSRKKPPKVVRKMKLWWQKRKELALKRKIQQLLNGRPHSMLHGSTAYNSFITEAVQEESVIPNLLQSRLQCQRSYQRPELTGYPNFCDSKLPEPYINPVNHFTEPAPMYIEKNMQSSNLQMHDDFIEKRMSNVTTSNEIDLPANQIGVRNRLKRGKSRRQNRSFRNNGSCVPFQSEEKSNASFSVASGSNSRRSQRKLQTVPSKKSPSAMRRSQLWWQKRKELVLKHKMKQLLKNRPRGMLVDRTVCNSFITGAVQDENIIPKKIGRRFRIKSNSRLRCRKKMWRSRKRITHLNVMRHEFQSTCTQNFFLQCSWPCFPVQKTRELTRFSHSAWNADITFESVQEGQFPSNLLCMF